MDLELFDMYDLDSEFMCDFNCVQCNRIYCSVADSDGED